ncbi:hypothetical protein AGMMS49936_07110 [Endomicrobiia bacterium]|nr:hypothetical protein AGMMS49936_07110 [Endomicrobiia bacterium]
MKRSLLVFCSFFALSIFAPAIAQATNQPLAVAQTFEIVREKPEGDAVKGKLTGGHNCDTLENNDFRNKEKTLRYIIPAGTYNMEVTDSKKFGRPMPLIKDVPDRDGIRFH